MNILALIVCWFLALFFVMCAIFLLVIIFSRTTELVARLCFIFFFAVVGIGIWGYGYDAPSRIPVRDYTVLIQEPLRVETLESNGHVSAIVTYVVSDVFKGGNTRSESTLDTCRVVDDLIAKSAHMNPKNVRVKILVRKNIFGGFAPHKREIIVLTDNELKEVVDGEVEVR